MPNPYQEKVTAQQAINRYWRLVALPFFLMFLASLAALVLLMIKDGDIAYIILAALGLPTSFLWGSIAYNRWFVWAFHSALNPNLLYRKAVRDEVVFPKESWKSKLTLPIGVHKQDTDAAWALTKVVGDVSTLKMELPRNQIVNVHYSRSEYYMQLGFTIFLIAFVGWMWFFSDDERKDYKWYMLYYGGWPFAAYMLWKLYDGYKKFGQQVMRFSPEGLVLLGESFSWDVIHHAEVLKQSKYVFAVYVEFYVINPVTFEEEIAHIEHSFEALDHSHDRIDELLAIYREIYAV